jgi:hypothetical protein
VLCCGAFAGLGTSLALGHCQPCFPRATGCAQPNLDPQLDEDVLHVRPHVIRGHGVNRVLSQETGDASVVRPRFLKR